MEKGSFLREELGSRRGGDRAMNRRRAAAILLTVLVLGLSGCTEVKDIRVSFLPEGCGGPESREKASGASDASSQSAVINSTASGQSASGETVSGEAQAENTGSEEGSPESTPAAKPTAIPPSVTVTPIPTSTPAPRMLGTKTIDANYIFLTNNTENPIRQFYMRENYTGGDWGRNLLPSETTIKTGETVQLFYPSKSDTDSVYDIKVVDRVGNSYAIYAVNFSDMTNAALRVQYNTAYISYMSLSSNKEMTADYSETLAINYSYDPVEDQKKEKKKGSSEPTNLEDLVDDPKFGYYDDGGNWTWYYDDEFMSHVGDEDYGYFTSDGYWIAN